MTTLRTSLLLPLFVLACAAGADGKNGLDGVAGADGTNGADGAAGADGTDDLALLGGTLAPGESLTLEHALGAGAFVEAQFTWNGVVYDHRDYATLRPGHVAADGAWFPGTDAEGYDGELGAARLASGDVAIAQNIYVGEDEDEFFAIDIRAWDGSLVGNADIIMADWYEDDASGSRWDPEIVALGDGGFVLFTEYEAWTETGGWVEGVEMNRYDASGVLQATEVFGADAAARSYWSFDATATPAGGFAIALYGDDEDLGDEVLDVLTWEPGSGSSTFRIFDVDDSDVRIGALPDGRYGLLVERLLSEDEPDGIDYLVVQPDGTIDAATRLQNSYMQEDSDLAVGSQGTVLVAAESGGPDLPFYAVFDLDGGVIVPATGMSGWENDQIHAAAFPDGDFLVMVWEDDSNAPMTWVMDAQGAMLRPMLVGDITGVPDDSRGAFLAGEGNTLGFVAASYDEDVPAHRATYTKGVLQLEVLSDTEVRLTNETPDTLDVMLAAHGAP